MHFESGDTLTGFPKSALSTILLVGSGSNLLLGSVHLGWKVFLWVVRRIWCLVLLRELTVKVRGAEQEKHFRLYADNLKCVGPCLGALLEASEFLARYGMFSSRMGPLLSVSC